MEYFTISMCIRCGYQFLTRSKGYRNLLCVIYFWTNVRFVKLRLIWRGIYKLKGHKKQLELNQNDIKFSQ